MSEALSRQPEAHHRTGITTALAAVFVLSPDSLIVRTVDADDPTVLLWRGGLMAVAMLAVLLATGGGVRDTIRVAGVRGLAAGACWAVATVMFVYSVRRTEVASTLVIVGAGPLFAALLGRVALHERVPRRTSVASAAVLVGLAWIFAGGIGRGTVDGDAAALVGSLAFAAFLTILRHGRRIDMTPALVAGGAAVAVAGLAVADPIVPRAEDVALLAVLGLAILPVSLTLTMRATRLLQPAEVSLLGRLETVLGPAWVWLVLGDAPPASVVLAGAVIVAATAAHSYAALRERRADTR